MSLLGAGVGALRSLANAVEALDGGGHGPWCAESKDWAPSGPDGRVLPIRISDDVIAQMWGESGWERASKAVHLRNLGDGTLTFFFESPEEVDQLSNRVVQQMMMTALDLSAALDSTGCDLSAEAIDALAAFKRAARQRLHS